MCKLWNCLSNDCHHCLHQAERAKKKPLKRTPLKKKEYKIKRESSKRAKQNREYSKQRKRILARRPICECGRVDENGKVCDRPATTIHHPGGRIGELLNDEDNMIPMALPCHQWVELHPLEAKELGLSKSRLKNNNMSKIIEMDSMCGNTIENCIKEAKAMAIEQGATVWFMFNGRKVTVNNTTNIPNLLRDYSTSWILDWKSIGPDCVETYSAEVKKEITIAEARLKAESEKREEERRQKDAQQKAELAALIDGIELQLTNADEYNKGKSVNADDSYGSAIYIFAEQWGKLMQVEISKGNKLIDVASETSYKADTVGLTGFMYGCAVQILSQCWIYGDELRKWHNKEYGVTEDVEGVVNPAILTIGKKV